MNGMYGREGKIVEEQCVLKQVRRREKEGVSFSQRVSAEQVALRRPSRGRRRCICHRRCHRRWLLAKIKGLSLLARKQINVMVTSSSAGENRSVGVEGRCGDGAAAVLLEEAGVRLKARQKVALKVENFDAVLRGATVNGAVSIYRFRIIPNLRCGIHAARNE